MRQTAVIVGGGMAGGSAASTLRQEGFDGRIVLLGAEEHPPYERPPLSKEFLRGEQPLEQGYLRPPDWYSENEIELLTGVSARRIDTEGKFVELDGDERVPYDMALIATGCRNRRFPIPGLDLEGVLDLRTAADAERIKQAAAAGGRAVVVGMGFIGAEVAASLRSLGVEVALDGRAGSRTETLERPSVGTSAAEGWARRHAGMIVQLVVFTGGAALLFLLRSHDLTACLAVLALALTVWTAPDGVACATMGSLHSSAKGDRPWHMLAALAWIRRSVFFSFMG